MNKVEYPRLSEVLYQETLSNGLAVYLLPKPGFKQVFTTFTTRYGSIDRVFKTANQSEFLTVPDGIAHFLEHKMFESEEGDVFSEFAKYGAAANAFTSFDQTSYLFSCTENALENARTLLDFVQHPYFTDENVEKEKGIIGQEIRMYEDNPEWRAFFGLLRGMYEQHPVRVDIAGTVESIAKIDKETLYRCYETFYHPGNMVFFAVGGFDAQAMLELIRENQARKSFGPIPQIERDYPKEPTQAYQPEQTARLSVKEARCLIGWKDAQTGLSGKELLAQEMLTGVLLDTLFGRGSDLYHELIDEKLIDQQFSWEYEATLSYGYSLVGGNTTDPKRLVARVNDGLTKVLKHGLSEHEFERNRRKAIGRFMSSLDSSAYVGRSFTSYILKGADLFDTLEVLEGLRFSQAMGRLQQHFQSSQQSVSMVVSKSQ